MSNKIKKIIDHFKHTSLIDNEDIVYFPNNYPFTIDEFKEVHGWLEKKAKHILTEAGTFENNLALINHNGTKFIWRLLIGQGSALQLLTMERLISGRGIDFVNQLEENKI
jgi:hypothetical protein